MVGIMSTVYVILNIFNLYLFYILIPNIIKFDIAKLYNRIRLYITIFSFIGIIIGIKGSFFYYGRVVTRVASIFFDPNYFGTLASIGFILSLNINNSRNRFDSNSTNYLF